MPPGPHNHLKNDGDPGAVVFTRRWRSGVKALTLVLCAYTGASCLMADWDARFGERHVFSGVRPAVRAYLTALLGPAPAAPSAGRAAAGGGERSSGGGSSDGAGVSQAPSSSSVVGGYR
jgi:hypothetical protein